VVAPEPAVTALQSLLPEGAALLVLAEPGQRQGQPGRRAERGQVVVAERVPGTLIRGRASGS
jgi:hypothetical protein